MKMKTIAELINLAQQAIDSQNCEAAMAVCEDFMILVTSPEEAVKKAFKKDVEIAQRWINVDDELPQYYQTVLADNGEYITVIARVSDGDEDSYIICGTDFYMNPDPIKWRSIELK